MLYFSELKNKKVYTEDGVYVGKLNDLIFTFSDVAKVSKLFITSDVLDEPVHVPINDLQKIGEHITIRKAYVDFELQENELYVGKNLVDKQIIDIEGRKVVRVNDVLLQLKRGNNLYITGADIGLLAILRWFSLEDVFLSIFSVFGYFPKPNVLSWKNIQPLELAEGRVVLNTQQDKLESFHPEDLADYLETTNIQNMIKTLDLVDKEFASEVIAELNLNYQIALFNQLSLKRTVDIISLMDPDEAVDVLLQFSPGRRKRVMGKLSVDVKKQLEGLIAVSRTTVGQYMTSEFVAIKTTDRVSKILEKIKKNTSDFDFLFYIYVVNSRKELVGAFTLHELVLQKQNTPAHKFMHTNLILAYLNTPIHLVIKRLINYKLYGLPVVTKSRKLLGVVVLDDIDEVLLDELE